MKLPLALVALSCAACSNVPTLRTVNSGAEVVYQTLHVVDVAQTMHAAANDRCYGEGDPLTQRLIGSKPSQAGVWGWGIGMASLHYAVHAILEDHAPPWVDSVWQAVTIGGAASAVGHNISIGVRLGGRNDDARACGQGSPPVVRRPGDK